MPRAAVSDDALSVTFGALADPTRRAIIARLAGGEATVNELAALFRRSRCRRSASTSRCSSARAW